MKARALLVLLALVCLPAIACGAPSGDSDEAGDGDADADADADADGDDMCAEEWQDKPNEGATPLQETWGAPCNTDQECVDLLGFDNAFCIKDILGVFELPGGYCSRPCDLGPGGQTTIADHPDCDPAGGVDCVGQDGFFEACALNCSEASECNREGYGCVRMPVISNSDDPTYCLMNADACCLEPSSCS